MARKSHGENWTTEDALFCIEGWAREGLTDKQIAKDKIGICENTFIAWKRNYPAIDEALKKGKAPVDFKVENQALKSALGYFVTVKKPIKVKTKKQLKDKGTIEEEHIEYVDEQIYIPPVPTLIIYWLKNRKPDKWRDKRDIVATSSGQLANLIDGLKEPFNDDLYTEAESLDGIMEDE